MDFKGVADKVKDSEKRAADKTAAANTSINDTFNKYTEDPSSGMTLYGSDEERQRQAANLSQVGAMSGQDLFQTGDQQQDYYNSLQSRRNGTDAASEFLKGQRNRNMATMGRQLAGKGISGSVAAASMMQGQQLADSQIADKMQGWTATNDRELWNYVKRNQKVTGEALAMGSDQGLADNMSTEGAQGAFGTVICTELHLQGYLSDEVYAEDVKAGRELEETMPYVMKGYRFLASPIVKGMKKSKLFTKAVSFWAIPWANFMAGKESIRADIVCVLGIPLCHYVGLYLSRKQVVA